MAINYTTDIVTGLYASKVATDAAYQSPGTYGIPSLLTSGNAGKRILCFVEILRAYMAVIDNNHEAKLVQDILGRMTAPMHFGAPSWNTTTMPANAQVAAMHFLASHVIASDI